jgi:hypothetical protein
MAERAHVASIEGIEAFRATLIVYLTKARALVDESCDDVLRTRSWLQSDRRIHWENELRRRTKLLEQARQALFSAGMSSLREPAAAERGALARAQRDVEEATAKLKRVRHWSREIDDRMSPLVKQLESLGTLLSSDMLKGAAYLAQAIRTLDAYAGMASPGAAAAPSAPAADAGAPPGGPGTPPGGSDDASRKGVA